MVLGSYSLGQVGGMEVFFATKELAGRLGSERNRVREFGAAAARRIDLRLQQLTCAPTLEHARSLPGRCQELDSDLHGHLAVDVQRPLRLIFRPTAALAGSDLLDWPSVDSITITDITNYQ
jgi:plasmid maintenance system killer protein